MGKSFDLPLTFSSSVIKVRQREIFYPKKRKVKEMNEQILIFPLTRFQALSTATLSASIPLSNTVPMEKFNKLSFPQKG